MKERRLVALVVFVISLVAACADAGGPTTRREVRAIQRDEGAIFAASIGDAVVRTEYSPATTLHEVVVRGRTLVHHGTAAEGWTDAALEGLDSDGFASSLDAAERAALERALDVIDSSGAPPSRRERARARFGAAYVVARVLGLVTRDPDRWPYPGFEDDADAPEELRGGGAEGARGYIPLPSFGCCGPKNCSTCVAGGLPCEDWCAAGDACNARFGNTNNRCGTANILVGNGNNCPHANSSCIRAAGGPASFCRAFRAGTAACR